MIAFEVPGEAIGFARAGSKGGQRFTPAKQRSYMGAVRQAAADAMQRAGLTPMEGPVRMVVRADYLVPPSWSAKKRAAAVFKTTKPDSSNIIKLVEDACNAVVYVDDVQIAESLVQKRYAPIAKLTVTIEPLEAA